jgi:hypothetical protein
MPTTATIRLAPATEPGGNLYNSYHLLTQISGLYAQAAEYEPQPGPGAVWRELCDASIKDLGELFHAWESVAAASRSGKGATIEAQVGVSLSRACGRVGRMVERLNVWTPMARWARLLALLERRWERYLTAFCAAGSEVKARLAPLADASRHRAQRLDELARAYRREGGEAAAAFKLVGS